MRTIKSKPQATPRGRNRHVAAYRRLVVSLGLAVPAVVLLGGLIDSPRYGYQTHRTWFSVYGGIPHEPPINLPGPTPYVDFYHEQTAAFTSVPFVAVLLGGLVCTLVVEARKRSGGRDR